MTEGDSKCVIPLPSCRIFAAQSRISATSRQIQLLSTARARKGKLSTEHLHSTSTLCQHAGETLHTL